jgi:hypothetical protein
MELEAKIAVASNPDAALLAARGFSGVTLIAEGHEAERLGDLPVGVAGKFCFRCRGSRALAGKACSLGIRKLRAPASIPARRSTTMLNASLRKVILNRKNALFYKTLNGTGSLVHTCELNGANPFDYLAESQRFAHANQDEAHVSGADPNRD